MLSKEFLPMLVCHNMLTNIARDAYDSGFSTTEIGDENIKKMAHLFLDISLSMTDDEYGDSVVARVAEHYEQMEYDMLAYLRTKRRENRNDIFSRKSGQNSMGAFLQDDRFLRDIQISMVERPGVMETIEYMTLAQEWREFFRTAMVASIEKIGRHFPRKNPGTDVLEQDRDNYVNMLNRSMAILDGLFDDPEFFERARALSEQLLARESAREYTHTDVRYTFGNSIGVVRDIADKILEISESAQTHERVRRKIVMAIWARYDANDNTPIATSHDMQEFLLEHPRENPKYF